jgi:NAD(P)-dependent dehydrogenase (short-subunit alcohol dehydrogenase family)
MAITKPVALVTGGANGIGRATAHHLLATGWRVGIIDRPGSGLKRAFSPRDRNVALFEGDVREEESISRAVKMFVAQFGRLDAVVSNAGIMIRKPLRRLTLAEWHRVIDTNLTAAFLLARAAERPLRKARGAIVLIASTRALVWSRTRNPIRRRRAGWSRSATRSPSASARTCASIASAPAGSQPGIMARFGKPQDIAEIVAWLVDAKRSGFVTGANFVIDGSMWTSSVARSQRHAAPYK